MGTKKVKAQRFVHEIAKSTSSYIGNCGLIHTLTDSLNYYLLLDFNSSIKDYSLLSRMQVEVLHKPIDADNPNKSRDFKLFDIGYNSPSKYIVLNSDNPTHPFGIDDVKACIINKWLPMLVPTMSINANSGGELNLYRSLLLFLQQETCDRFLYPISENQDTFVDLRQVPIYLAFNYSGKEAVAATNEAIKEMMNVKDLSEVEMSNHTTQIGRTSKKVLLLPIQCTYEQRGLMCSVGEPYAPTSEEIMKKYKPIIITKSTFDKMYALCFNY